MRRFFTYPSFLTSGSYPLLIVALSVFAWAPLLTPAYFFNAHDARHSVFFLVEFDQTLRDGYLWPRWAPDFAFGYGYPLFNMYAPLAFYVAELLHLLGLGFTAAIKTMYILATIGAGLAMYGFVQRLLGRRAGLLAALVYIYAPFHLLEIFVRSAYAEFVALALVPLVFWAFTGLIAAPGLRRLALAGAAYGLLALTHHAIFLTFSPLLVLYILFLVLARSRLELSQLFSRSLYALLAGLLGLALAAIYLLPVLAETRYIKVEQWTSGSYNYLQHFVYFAQFFSPEWGYGYAGAGLADDLSFQLGIVVFSLVIFAGLFSLGHHFPHRSTVFFFLVATLLVVLLMSPLAGPVWQLVPIVTLVQFPWRLLGMTAFTMSIVAGAVVAREREEEHQSTGLAIIRTSARLPASPLFLVGLIVILGSFPYTLPQYTDIPAWAETPLAVINWDRASIVDRVGMVAATQEQPQTSPLEPLYLAAQPLEAGEIIQGQGTVETLHRGGASSTVRVTAGERVTFQFYTYDYPGWRVSIGNRQVLHRAGPPHGLITVDVPAGEQVVHLEMGPTPARSVGAVLSGAALAAIAALILLRK